MALITRTQIIDRPVDDVFDTVIDAGNYASWNPTITASRRMDEGEIGDGSRFEWKLRGFGKITNELREFERNKRVMVAPLTNMLDGGHRWLFTDLGNGETRIDHELELDPKGVFRLLKPMLRANGKKTVRETAAALKTHLEIDRGAAR